MIRLQATIHGRVHGVGFRYQTSLRARALGVVGHVRNQHDRTVAVVAEGDRSALRALLEWLDDGPPMAHVSRIEKSWTSASGEFTIFEVRF